MNFIKRINSFIFVFGFFSCILFIWTFYAFQNNTKNDIENRMSYQFKDLKKYSFMTNDFQYNMEQTLSDQLPFYEYIKPLYPKISQYLNIFTIDLLGKENEKMYLGGTVYLLDDYLVYNSVSFEDLERFSKNDIDSINNIINNTSANVYFYFIETDSTYNLEDNYSVGAYEYLMSKINIDDNNTDKFEINSFLDYKKYFYKEDHHWNYKGSYKAYLDIVKMMNFNTVIPIENEICFNNIPSYGSKSRRLAINNFSKEILCKYVYKFPKFEFEKNKQKIMYYEIPINKLLDYSKLTYDNFYIGSYAELIFRNLEAKDEKKLLIYSNSFSAIINQLLASNYKYTYLVDGRYYEEFNMIDYINKNEIDDVLILANYMLLYDDIDW